MGLYDRYKWSFNPYTWPCKWVTGVIAPWEAHNFIYSRSLGPPPERTRLFVGRSLLISMGVDLLFLVILEGDTCPSRKIPDISSDSSLWFHLNLFLFNTSSFKMHFILHFTLWFWRNLCFLKRSWFSRKIRKIPGDHYRSPQFHRVAFSWEPQPKPNPSTWRTQRPQRHPNGLQDGVSPSKINSSNLKMMV